MIEKEQVWGPWGGEIKTCQLDTQVEIVVCVYLGLRDRGFEARQYGMSWRNDRYRSGWLEFYSSVSKRIYLRVGGVKK